MATDWVREKFEQREKDARERQLRESLDHRALEVSENMFHSLSAQVEKDVGDYNSLTKQPLYRFSPQHNGFLVERVQGFPNVSLLVRKSRGQTAIPYTITTIRGLGEQPVSSEDHITIAPNYSDGDIYYRHAGKWYKDPSGVSELLLRAILK